MSCYPKPEAVKFGLALCGRRGPQSSSFYATTGESSAANMSRSCASTKVSLSKAEPPWPQLDSVTFATLACFGKRLASPFRYL